MFDHFVLSVLMAPVLVVAASALFAEYAPPASGAVIAAWSAVGAALASVANLAVFALKAAAGIPAVAGYFDWSHRTVVDDTAHVPWVSWLSLALLIYSLTAAARVWSWHQREFKAAEIFGDLPAHEQVVVIPHKAADAFAVPGPPGRVVITTRMREILDPGQYAALIAHERAHLDAGHHRLVFMAELAGAAHPALRWAAQHVSYLVERAADEQAAHAVGNRRTVARAIGTAALAASARPLPHHTLHIASPSSIRPGTVPRRVRALLTPRTRRRPTWLGLIPVVLAISSVIWTGEAIYDLQELLRMAAVKNR